MNYLKAPQVFHDKPDNTNEHFVMFTNELFAAINTLFSGNEAKIMLALYGCKGDGSFCPSAEYMMKMTGISKRENYFRTRKQLIDKGYIERCDNELYLDSGYLLQEYYRVLNENKCKNDTTTDVKITASTV